MKLRLWCLATLLAGCTIGGPDEASIDPHMHELRSIGASVDPPDDGDHLGSTVQALAPSDTNGIAAHGGDVMRTVNVYYIWYGNWTSSTARSILTDLANTIGGSLYWNINTTYFGPGADHVPGAVHFAGAIDDRYSFGSSLSDTTVGAVVASAITSHRLPSDSSGVYFVLGSADVDQTSGMCSVFCGKHYFQTLAGTQIKYAYVGDAARCPSACMAQPNGPNNNPGADAMASVIAHELEEAATDPDLDAWWDSYGQENADKCAWTFGAEYRAANGTLANMRLGARDFLIQQNWVNAQGGRCANLIHYDSLAGVITEAPAVSSFGSNELDAFARGTDNALWHRSWGVLGWSTWDRVGFVLNSAPAAVSSSPGVIDVFWRGTDSTLRHATYDHGWSAEQNLGGIITAAPAAASWGGGRVDVFVRALDNSLAHISRDFGAWSGWENLGGSLTSAPAAVSWSSGRIDIVWRGADLTLQHRWYQSGAWSGFEPLGDVAIASSPAIASWGPGHLDVVARSFDNTLLHRGYPASIFGGWTGFESLGVTTYSAPAAVSWGPGRIDVFMAGDGSALWHADYDGVTW